MSTPSDPTRAALAEADRNERLGRLAVLGAAAFEALALAAALLIADFDDRTHLLAITLAVLVYGTLTLGLVVLDARRRAGEHRLLRAMQLLGVEEKP